MTYAYGAVVLNAGCSEIKDNKAVKTFMRRSNACFQIEKINEISLHTYEHVTKRVVNVENGIYRYDNPSARIEKSKYHIIHVTHSLLENDVMFLIPAYY